MFADVDCVLPRLVYCSVLERPLQELREELQTEVTEALASYRKHCCSASVSAGQVRSRRSTKRLLLAPLNHQDAPLETAKSD